MEKLERLSIFDKEPEPIPEVDFYVTECSEFPSLGEYHEGLTIDEAIAVYEKYQETEKRYKSDRYQPAFSRRAYVF